jgi:hypothetical protein
VNGVDPFVYRRLVGAEQVVEVDGVHMG